ncbi:TPA: hypothetical protein ACH3X1_005390 [Trebouxia sp. C0004]
MEPHNAEEGASVSSDDDAENGAPIDSDDDAGSDGIAGEAANEQAEDMLQPVDQIKANLALSATDHHVASDTHVHLNCYREGKMMTIAWAVSMEKLCWAPRMRSLSGHSWMSVQTSCNCTHCHGMHACKTKEEDMQGQKRQAIVADVEAKEKLEKKKLADAKKQEKAAAKENKNAETSTRATVKSEQSEEVERKTMSAIK